MPASHGSPVTPHHVTPYRGVVGIFLTRVTGFRSSFIPHPLSFREAPGHP